MINQKGSTFIKVILIVIVILLLILIGLGIYVYISIKPFLSAGGLPFLGGSDEMPMPPIDSHPLLDDQQENRLRSIGIDPAKLPTEITPEMENCFILQLGEDRIREIIDGATPSPLDILRGQSCLNQ